MLEIKGKVNSAICYAQTVDEESIQQIRMICDQEFSRGSKIRIMPDVHIGTSCTIGTTMTVEGMAVPNIVGVDIGCGMYTVELGNVDIDFEKLDEACHYIPSGIDTWDAPYKEFDIERLHCYDELTRPGRLLRSLATLGGGNHFIEVDVSADGNKYLVIHSGSRNLGKQVAEYYQRLAVDLHAGKADFYEKRNELIEEYKKDGRDKEISQALTDLADEYSRKEPDMPPEICYLYGEAFDKYIHDVKICQEFARTSRETMAEIMLERLGLTAISSFHTVHNYIDTESMILRKGAVSAKRDEILLIPINMRDGSILARGLGNPDWNCSAPHGAGRLMSRAKARATISLEDYEKSMQGIYTTSVGKGTIDESPMAYKSLDEIVEGVRGSVEIIEVLKPVFNFKAG